MPQRSLAFIALCLLIGSACSHDVFIRTQPAGAQVFVDGTLIGKSPTIYEEKLGPNKVVELQFKKEGYKTKKKYLERSRFNVPVIAASVAGCCVGTVCCTGVISDVAEGSEPLGLVGGLSVLAVPFVARQSAQDVFVKLDKDPAQNAAGPASPTVRAAPSAGTNDPSDAAMDAASPTAPDVPQAPETPQLIRLPDGYSY